MNNILDYLLDNPANIITVLTLGMFFLGAALFYINRKIFLNPIKNTNKTILVILILLVFCFASIIIFNFKSFSPSDQEWEELNYAKSLSLGDRSVFNHQRYGLVYPLLLSMSSKIFGFTQYTASYLNLLLIVFSIFLVFILSKIIFNNDLASLLSVIIYILTPSILFHATLRMGFPTIIGFFLLLVVLVCLLSFRYHKLSLYILALLLIALASQTKPEYFILVFPFVLCFSIFKEYKFLSFKKIILLVLLFILFFAPFFIKNAQFRDGFASGWCGDPSQTFHDGKEWSYDLPIASQLDNILKPLTNNRFSVNYFIYDLPNFIKFWSSESFVLILPFLLLGLFVALQKKYRRDTIFILFVFLFLSFVYLADCAFYEQRYAIATYGPMVIFSGFGINLLGIRPLKDRKGTSLLAIFILFAVILLLTLSFINHLSKYSYQHKNFSAYSDYQGLKEMSRNISPKDSFIFVVHNNEREILKLLGYDVISISDMVRISYFKNPEEFFKSFKLLRKLGKKNYFISSWYCQTLIPLQETCDFIINNYTEKEIDQKDDYLIYLLKEI